MKPSKQLQEAIARGKTSYDVPSPAELGGDKWYIVDKNKRIIIGPYNTEELAMIHAIARKPPPKPFNIKSIYGAEKYSAAEIEDMINDHEAYNFKSQPKLKKPSKTTIKIHPEWKKEAKEKNERNKDIIPEFFDPTKWDDVILIIAGPVLYELGHYKTNRILIDPHRKEDIRKRLRKLS